VVAAGASARSISLPSDPRAARTARRFVRDALTEWGLDDVDQIAELLTDELVGNVVRHVGSPMEVRASHRPETIRIEVDDASPQPPIRRHADQLDEHGRGILFIEMLATDWGVEVREGGKTVWFELPATPTGELPVVE
jgi:anti-sigma regulatory factor (Ser/Thr protein kinase)